MKTPTGLQDRFMRLGIDIGQPLLLPRHGTDLTKWATIACDQYTSERDYWEKAEQLVGSAPSTLRCILPEAYLDEAETRLPAIKAAMESYRRSGILRPIGEGIVYLERSTPYHKKRRGLALAVDLERYDYDPQARGLIRTSESTVTSRIPPRLAIRRGAAFEFSHVLMLYDDDHDEVMKPIEGSKDGMEKLYSFDLMAGAGSISGWLVQDPGTLGNLASSLEALASPDRCRARYGSDSPLLFAVGDGNHSLAAAKAYWEETKAAGAGADSPERFALVELVSFRDEGLSCLPIHRFVFGAASEDFASFLEKEEGFIPTQGTTTSTGTNGIDLSEGERDGWKQSSADTAISVLAAEGERFFRLPDSNLLAVAAVEPAIERYLRSRPGTRVDYIHGLATLRSLANERKGAGVALPPIAGDGLFTEIARSGSLPRKSFSLGESCEKRFYVEGRALSRYILY